MIKRPPILIGMALHTALIPLPVLANPALAVTPDGWLQYCGLSQDTSCDLRRPLRTDDLAWVRSGIAGQLVPPSDPMDRWEAFPVDRVGDREDYALSMRAALIAFGHAVDSMAIVIGDARTVDAVGSHAMLEVTLGGDVSILYNLVDQIYRPYRRPYKSQKRPGESSAK